MKTNSHLTILVAVLVSYFLLFGCIFVLALEEALGPSHSFVRQFWLSLAGTASLGAAGFVVTRCRGLCARLADAEQEIGKRSLGKRGLRSLEGRSCRVVVWTLFGLYAALTLVIGGTYLHFRNR